MIAEILIIICAVVAFVNSLFILMLVLAVGKLIRKYGAIRELIEYKNLKMKHCFSEKLCKVADAAEKDTASIRAKIDQLFVIDYYGYEDPERMNILKSEAVQFERVQDVGPEDNKKLTVMKYYTSKDNADKHKNELKDFEKEVEKFRAINANIK